jgi:hypothetical protein
MGGDDEAIAMAIWNKKKNQVFGRTSQYRRQ